MVSPPDPDIEMNVTDEEGFEEAVAIARAVLDTGKRET
jgi:hypothetical protein